MTVNPMHRGNDAPSCKAKSKRTACRVDFACGRRLSRLSDARRSGWRTDRQEEWEFQYGGRTKVAIQAVRLVNLLSRLARKS